MDEDEYVDNGDEDDEEEEEYEEDDEEEDGVAGQPNGIKSALNGYSKDVAGYARGWLSHDFELSGMLISWVWMSQAIRRRDILKILRRATQTKTQLAQKKIPLFVCVD